MMKKLLILMLVLGMTSLAGAAFTSPLEIVDLTGGVYAIDAPSGLNNVADGGGGYFALCGPDALNAVTGGLLTADATVTMEMSNLYGDSAGMGLGLDYGIWGEFSTMKATYTAAPGIYADSFSWLDSATYVGPEITMTLYGVADDFSSNWVIDTYTIPEPMTIALLGLGGLFLLRRRK